MFVDSMGLMLSWCYQTFSLHATRTSNGGTTSMNSCRTRLERASQHVATATQGSAFKTRDSRRSVVFIISDGFQYQHWGNPTTYDASNEGMQAVFCTNNELLAKPMPRRSYDHH